MNEFKNSLHQKLQKEFPDIEVKETETVKMNDQKLTGFTFNNDKVALPTVWINEYFTRYKNGESIDFIADEIATIIEMSADGEIGEILAPPEEIYQDMKKVYKKHVYPVLISKSRNREFLKTVPYRDLGEDLVFVYQIRVNKDEGFFATVINNGLDVDEEDLFDHAMKNLNKKQPVIAALSDAVMGSFENLYHDKELPCGHFILSDGTLNSFSAALLFKDGLMEKIADKYGCGYYILPSSVHEVILIPDKMVNNIDALKGMILTGNEEVIPGEILSEKLFHFDKRNGFVSY